METVLQRCIQNLQRESDERVAQFREEIHRLQSKCSDLQVRLLFERSNAHLEVIHEVQQYCQHNCKEDGRSVRADLLCQFLCKRATAGFSPSISSSSSYGGGGGTNSSLLAQPTITTTSRPLLTTHRHAFAEPVRRKRPRGESEQPSASNSTSNSTSNSLPASLTDDFGGLELAKRPHLTSVAVNTVGGSSGMPVLAPGGIRPPVHCALSTQFFGGSVHHPIPSCAAPATTLFAAPAPAAVPMVVADS